MKDRLGTDLAVGDFIVYARMRGNITSLGFGEILELKPDAGKYKTKITVDSQQGWDYRQWWPKKVKQKVVNLMYPERVAKVELIIGELER